MSLAKSATIQGIIDQHGTRWVLLETALGTCSLSMTEVVEPSKAAPKLAEIGIVLPPGKSRSDFFARISAIAKYDAVHVVDQTGWHRHVFAIGDGGQVAPSGAAPLPSMMRTEPRAWTTQGSLKAWKNKVAKPLTGQRIPMFVIALAFAPAIIRFLPVWTNPGFELVGTRGTGKSTALQLASSVYGGIGDGDGRRYWATWNTTVAGMETLLDGHTNCLLPLDELNAFSGGATAAAKRKAYSDVLFQLADGINRTRYGDRRGRQHSLCYLSTSNTSLIQELRGCDAQVVAACSDRLLTINADAGADLGIFDFVPAGFPDTKSLIDHLKAGASENHGAAIRPYLQHLVDEAAEDLDGLTAKLGGWSKEFLDRAGLTKASGSEFRTASQFALVYAAGRLAQSYGVLPKRWRCGPSVMACYVQHRLEKSLALGGPQDMILAYKALPGILSDTTFTADAFRASPGVLVRHRDYDELIVHPKALAARIRDSVALVKQLKAVGIAVCEPGTLQTKRSIEGKQVRVHCFRFERA